jgi:hypothetical protein
MIEDVLLRILESEVAYPFPKWKWSAKCLAQPSKVYIQRWMGSMNRRHGGSPSRSHPVRRESVLLSTALYGNRLHVAKVVYHTHNSSLLLSAMHFLGRNIVLMRSMIAVYCIYNMSVGSSAS